MDVATLQQDNHILFMISVFRNLMFQKMNEKHNQKSVKISHKQPQTPDSVVISCSVSNTEKVAWILLFFYLTRSHKSSESHSWLTISPMLLPSIPHDIQIPLLEQQQNHPPLKC